jgi:heat shock protein HslJ
MRSTLPVANRLKPEERIRRHTSVKPTLLIAALSIAIASCSMPEASPPGLIGDWEMTGGTLAGAPFPLVDGHRITITFSEDGSVGGVAACNSYGGSYVADGEDVIIDDELASTAMACGEAGVMESEQAFLSSLRGPLAYVRTGDVLSIEGSGAVMMFAMVTPVPRADLIDTRWVLDTLISGDTAQSVQGDPATLVLSGRGRITGSTGCRVLEGDYVIDGDTVLFTTFSALGECATELASQDGLVVTVLGDGFTVEIEGDRLTVTSRGNESLVYRRGD